MSWDIYVWNFDGNLPPADDALRVWYSTHDEEVAEDAYGDLPPLSDERVAAATSKEMGTPAEVRAKIDAHLPGVEWSDDFVGLYGGDGFTLEIYIDDRSELDGFLVMVRGSGDSLSPLLQFATPNGWSLFDTTTEDFIDPENPSDAGLTAWQQTQDIGRDYMRREYPDATPVITAGHVESTAEQTSESSAQPVDIPQPPGLGFFLWWVVAATLGGGGLVGVSSALDIGDAAALALAWGLVGLLQWLALRRHLTQSERWLLASGVAAAVNGVLNLVVTAEMIVLGGVVGILQWLAMRQQVPRAGVWVLMSVLGVRLGGAAGEAVAGIAGTFGDIAVGWAVYGAITGASLVWLLRQRAATAADTTTAAP